MKNIYLIAFQKEEPISFPKHNTIGQLIKDHLPSEATALDYVEDLEAYLNEKEEELPKDKDLESLEIRERDKIIFSRCKKVEVKVHFNGQVYQHHFRPNQKIGKVREKAAEHFGISTDDASSLLLYPHGSDSNINDGKYLAWLVNYPSCGIELDLSKDLAILG